MSALLLFSVAACAKTPEAPASGPEAPSAESEPASRPEEPAAQPEEPSSESEEASSDEPEEPVSEGPKLIFDTTDLEGNAFTMESLGDATLIMVNMWEPWCGPCVNELPELQELYEKYKDEGLLIVGAFSTTDMDSEVAQLVQSAGLSYPVVRADANILQFATQYVPTTVFFDAEGNLLSKEPVVGANNLAGWEAIVKSYLE